MLLRDILDKLPNAYDWYNLYGDRHYRVDCHNLDNDIMYYPLRNGTEPCNEMVRVVEFRVVRWLTAQGNVGYYWDMII